MTNKATAYSKNNKNNQLNNENSQLYPALLISWPAVYPGWGLPIRPAPPLTSSGPAAAGEDEEDAGES